MEDKTCGECKFYGIDCTIVATARACVDFEQKVITNGDVIRQGGNRAIAEFHQKPMCSVCVYKDAAVCKAPNGKMASCVDGIEAWLNAPAESQLNDAIQNVIKDGAKNAIDIHEDSYAPDMNVGTMAVCVSQNGKKDTQTDLCCKSVKESEGKDD